MHVTRVPSTTMLPRLALVAGVALAGSLLAPSPAPAQSTGVVTYAKKASFDDVRFELNNVIVGRGLAIDFNGQVSKMLERTGADVGSTKPIYKKAEYFTFCSAKLSRQAMEADGANISVCPYVVFIYEKAAAPGTVHVGYRKSPLTGSVASKKALGEINKLLDGIAKDAVKEAASRYWGTSSTRRLLARPYPVASVAIGASMPTPLRVGRAGTGMTSRNLASKAGRGVRPGPPDSKNLLEETARRIRLQACARSATFRMLMIISTLGVGPARVRSFCLAVRDPRRLVI